jgi:hypothetical protein
VLLFNGTTLSGSRLPSCIALVNFTLQRILLIRARPQDDSRVETLQSRTITIRLLLVPIVLVGLRSELGVDRRSPARVSAVFSGASWPISKLSRSASSSRDQGRVLRDGFEHRRCKIRCS